MKFLTLSLLILLVSCLKSKETKVATQKLTKKEMLFAQAKNLPVIQTQFWGLKEGIPLEDKILLKAPAQIIEYLLIMNEADGYSEQPRVVIPDQEWIVDIKKALGGLPENIRKLINKNVTAVTFVKELGGTAIVPSLLDQNKKPVSSIVIFDLDSLNRKANEWCSWKESSTFSKVAGYQLKCTIADEKDNSRANAIQYILLHEMGHIILADKKLDFPYDRFAFSQTEIDEYAFGKLSWKFLAPFKGKYHEYLISKFDDIFPERKDLMYYRKNPELSMSKAKSTYENLSKTNFSTLYAASNPNDDVADSVANYIHTQILKKPFKIEILKDDKVMYTYKDCWNEKRCEEKRQILEKYLTQ